MRRRKKDHHLPSCVYLKHGAYYLVRKNKWMRLGTSLPEAMERYGRMTNAGRGDMVSLLDETMTRAEERGLATNTLAQYGIVVRRLQSIMAEFSVDEVRPVHVSEIMDHYRHTPNAANRMRSVLKLAFDLAVRKGLCDTNPVISIPRLKERARDRLITADEWDAIYQIAPPALRCIMDIAYYTAQRIGDVLAIRLSDISDDGIIFRQQKTGKRLMVRMTPELRAAERRARNLHRVVPMYLLGQRNGNIRSYRAARDLLIRYAARAGVPNVGWHDIRAKSLTDAKKQGKNAQALAGHTSEAQTRRYLRSKEVDAVDGPGEAAGQREVLDI